MAAVKFWFQNAIDISLLRGFVAACLIACVAVVVHAEEAGSSFSSAEGSFTAEGSKSSPPQALPAEGSLSSPPQALSAAGSVSAEGSPSAAGSLSAEGSLSAAGSLSAEGSDTHHLEARLQGLKSFSAAFTQDIQGARGQLLERSSGRVTVLRPAFRWQVDDPYPQIIVADQALLKIYDPDLEQLTIRPMDEALKDTPISLLSQDAISLDGDFAITRVPEVDGDGEMYIIVPRSDETLYAEIRLQFSARHLTGLGILDHLGQYTQISFEPDPDSTVIQSSVFTLEVPPGTDVIGG